MVDMSAAQQKLVPFSKYQGLGNDFILVDNREEEEPMITARESADLCDRCVWEGEMKASSNTANHNPVNMIHPNDLEATAV